MEEIVRDAKQEEIKEILKETPLINSSIIQDNKLEFKVGTSTYRVRTPNQRELAQAEDRRYKAWVQMLHEENTITKKKLIALLKDKQDIDIVDLELKKKKIEARLHESYLNLALCKDEEKDRIQKYIQQIEDIRKEYIDAFIEIENYLAPAIENRIEGLYLKYLTVSCADKYNEETKEWELLWKTYSDFEKDDSPIAVQACLNFGYIYKFNRGY